MALLFGTGESVQALFKSSHKETPWSFAAALVSKAISTLGIVKRYGSGKLVATIQKQAHLLHQTRSIRSRSERVGRATKTSRAEASSSSLVLYTP
jgi:nitrate/nitrite-specific signal transduction histidine kinase